MKKRYFACIAALALFGILAAYSIPARDGAARGLTLWGNILVPSLLPYFTAAGLLTRLGFISALGKRLEGPGRRLFHVGGTGFTVFLMGLSGGYPLGASAAAEAVRSGALSHREASELLAFCDNTGPAFAVGALGAGVFGSAKWGLFLWGVHALSAAFLLAAFGKEGTKKNPPAPAAEPLSPGEAFTGAVSAAVSALLSIGGDVIFFSALLGVTESMGFPGAAAGALALRLGGDPRAYRAMLTGMLELSGGIGAMMGLPLSPGTLALGSFLLGWGGLCVHLQSAAVTQGTGISLKRRFRGKLLHASLSALITLYVSGLIL